MLNIASMRRYLISDEEKETLISISRELGGSAIGVCSDEERQKSAQNIRTLFQSIDDIVSTKLSNLKGDIITMNAAAGKGLSYARQELIGLGVFLTFWPPKRRSTHTLCKLVDGNGRDSCVPNRCKRLNPYRGDTKVTRGKWDDRDVLIGVSRGCHRPQAV